MGSALRLLLSAVLALAASGPAVLAQSGTQADSIELFVAQLEQIASTGDRSKVLALRAPAGDLTGIEDFSYTIVPKPARIVVKERDRARLDDGMWRLLLEVFVERGIEARVSTWRLDLTDVGGTAAEATTPPANATWRVNRLDRLTVVSGLYKLALDPAKQFDVRDLTLRAPDLTLHLPQGSAFLAETPEGPTAVVLIGRGRMKLAPPEPAEQTQLRIFGGDDALDAEFDAAFIRVRPSEFKARFSAEALTPREPSSSDLHRAEEVFDEYIGKTLQVDMSDLSRERWSLVPSTGDFITEIRTRRHGSLTYARTWNDSEDISFFDRRRRRNIAVYASREKLAARGRFYSEDDLIDYDVLSYEIEAAFNPERQWVAGNTRLRLKVRSMQMTTLTLRLAESLAVRGVYSPEFGRLLHLRIVNQNSLIVNLPEPVARDSELTLNVVYGGRVEPQELDREAIAVSPPQQDQDVIQIPLEPRYIYSNRSYWYPQGSVTDYATARVRLSVPDEYDIIASGMPVENVAPAAGPVAPGERPRKVFVFQSERPVRYIGCVISRFSTVTNAELTIGAPERHGGPEAQNGGGDFESSRSVSLIVQANPRHVGRARSLAQKAGEILQFYASLAGEAPYPSFTLAVTESDLPGGHSPAYFAILNQPLLASQVSWRSDPVAFDNYPSFFLAHELAHQWWGQAIGWKNYHEQWISEGFSQYFATLYAEKERGTDVMLGILRQMRRTAMSASPQGPVYLGYRLGHIRSDSTVFRSLVYNKGAMVLHMLRRVVGDEAFFQGVRDFYLQWRFKKAGTDDFRRVMEDASKRDLGPFFEGWIYGGEIPRVKFNYAQQGESLNLRFEHRAQVMPVAVSVKVTYASGETAEHVVVVGERVVERSLPVSGKVRKVEVNTDHSALAEFEK
jgi:hypothetical protein